MMAPWMAALVCWCALLCFVLFDNAVSCDGPILSYNRKQLINIKVTVPVDFFPSFINTSVDLLNILVKGPCTFVHVVKRRRRGI